VANVREAKSSRCLKRKNNEVCISFWSVKLYVVLAFGVVMVLKWLEFIMSEVCIVDCKNVASHYGVI
jgi:hypothetical protein